MVSAAPSETCIYCMSEVPHDDDYNFCERCGFPVRSLAEIPEQWVEDFKRRRPKDYALAVAWFGGVH